MSSKKAYDILDHAADAALVAYGTNMAEAFTNAARATFSFIVDPDTVHATRWQDVNIEAPNQESLLVNWLNELLYFFDAEQLLFNRFEIEELTDHHLDARCYGEKADLVRHNIKTGVKAATYHKLKIATGQGGCKIHVILDL